MASIKDALEDSIQDGFAWIKYIIFTIPVFIVAYSILQGKIFPQFTTVVILTFLLILGFTLKCTYNVRMGNTNVLPSFNIISVLWLGFRGALALAPMGLVAYFASVKIIEIISRYIPVSWVYYFLTVSTCLVLSSFVFTGYLLFSKRFKITDAYNIKHIFKYCIDVLFATLFMLFLVAILAAVITTPVTYLVWIFMGLENPVILFIWCMIGVLCLAIMGHYLAQMDYEILPHDEDN